VTPQQARFVQEYLLDQNATRAAIAAGYSPRSATSTASHLLANPDIATAIASHRAEVATEARISVTSLLAEAEEARAAAQEAGNASAMVAASTFKAKLLGMLADDAADVLQRDKQAAEREQASQFKTASQLLGAAAVSMGLPADATPAQIVGAAAERTIATPEVFALLRAREVEEA
jgi:phage terminase small subunit